MRRPRARAAAVTINAKHSTRLAPPTCAGGWAPCSSLRSLSISSSRCSRCLSCQCCGQCGCQVVAGPGSVALDVLAGLVPAIAYGVLAALVLVAPRQLGAMGELQLAGEVCGRCWGDATAQ